MKQIYRSSMTLFGSVLLMFGIVLFFYLVNEIRNPESELMPLLFYPIFISIFTENWINHSAAMPTAK